MNYAKNSRRHGSDDDEKDEWDEILERMRVSEGEVLLSYSDAFRRLGLLHPLDAKLGRGSFGHAYDLGNGKVLKITRDTSEALASRAIAGKNLPHVVRVESVWALKRTQISDAWTPWYAITREKLEPLAEDDNFLFEEAIFKIYDDEDIDIKVSPSAAMRKKWKDLLQERLRKMKRPDGLKRCMEMLDAATKGASALKTVGVDWFDLVPDNVMLDKEGVMRISDVGYSDYTREGVVEFPELQ